MAIEARSIDWVPETERHGRIWHQAPLWFLGNFQYFSIPIGFIAAIDPATAAAMTLAMRAYLGAIPEPLYALFGTSYLGYTAARQWG